MSNQLLKNTAFIDGQNLSHAYKNYVDWKIDTTKLYKYLQEKYHVETAYYYIGVYMEDLTDLYNSLQRAGYILVFREHTKAMRSSKKGNIDTGIVFDTMRGLLERTITGGVVLISNDGDYFRMVQYLHKAGRLVKVLHPTRKNASSLYHRLSHEAYAYLDDARNKIEYIGK